LVAKVLGIGRHSQTKSKTKVFLACGYNKKILKEKVKKKGLPLKKGRNKKDYSTLGAKSDWSRNQQPLG